MRTGRLFMDKKQFRGALVLIVTTFVILGSLTLTGVTGATSEAVTLTGSGQGYADQIVVEVTVDGDTITAIEVIESNDTPGLSDNAFDALIEAVLANQSVDGVDIVSGATYSSEGLLAAIRNALSGDTAEESDAETPAVEGEVFTGSGSGYDGTVTVEVTVADDGTIAAIEVVESSDTPGLSDNAFNAIIESVLANQSVEGVDVVTGATGSSEGILQAINEALQAAGPEEEAVIEGGVVYTGSGQGYEDAIVVEVTMVDDTIAAIKVVEANDTPRLSDNAYDAIIEAVLANQSVEGVDVVAGATASSEGVLEAIAAALSEVE